MPGTLLVVDVQVGFINDFTRQVPGRIARLIERDHYDSALMTRFINEADGPYHRFLDWHECVEPPATDIVPKLKRWASPERVYTKPGFTGISDQLGADLCGAGDDEVAIVGSDTDRCVLKIAMDVFDSGIKPVVLVDCCASTAGLQAHLAGLAVLARNIGANQLHDAGLSGGLLGAPPDDAPDD